MDIRVEALHEATVEAVEAFERLLPQLSTSAPPLTRAGLAAVLSHPTTTVLVARGDGPIVGALTLIVVPIPTGVRTWIEDVVVDADARGSGIGAALTREAIRVARDAGARTVDLTSRPSRTAANQLYQRLGFQARETNVYRYEILAEPS